MRPMSFLVSLPFAAGFAIALSSAVLAEPAASFTPISAGRMTDLEVHREPTPAAPGPRAASSRASEVTPRGGGFSNAFVTMRDELENFPTETSFGGMGVSAPATSFTGPPGFVWPLNTLRGQPSADFVRLVDLSSAPVGGVNGVVNASKSLRIRTATAQSPGGFFQGATLRFGGQPDGSTLPLEPLAGMNARVSAEHWLSGIDTLYSFDPSANFTGLIVGRMIWGGTCPDAQDCSDLGLPIGPITHLYYLAEDCFVNLGDWLPASYCETQCGVPIPGCVPHPGFAIGDPVAPPVQNWFRLAAETTADGQVNYLLDLLDGSPESTIASHFVTTSPYLDGVGWNASYEAQDEFMLVDNIEASGPLFQMADPPPLECPYLDDIEWLPLQLVRGQSTRWIAEPSASPRVVSDGAQGRVIRQLNQDSSNSRYRRGFATSLPTSNTAVSNDVVATVKVATTDTTVRGVALFGADNVAARVLFGRDDGSAAPGWFTPRVYVQTNPDYDPIDPVGVDPYLNIPIVGVDVADTQYDWQGNGVYRTLELRLSANGVLRVSIDGQRIYAGNGAFSNSIDTLAFESENNALGFGASLRIDDVTLTCDAPSCAADFDLDDAITFGDLNAVLSNFGASGLPSGTVNPGDANGDRVVDFTDLNAVLASFGAICD